MAEPAARRSRAVFAPLVIAIALVVVGGVFAVGAGSAGMRFLPGLNLASPPLAELEPHLAAPRPPRARRVVLAIADGLSLDHSYSLSYLDHLRGIGVDARAQSHSPTISRPNYVSIVTGVPPEQSGVRTNDFGRHVTLDSIMDRLGASGKATAYVSDSSDGLPFMFSDDLEDSTYAPWPQGFVKAVRLAIARDYPLVVLVPGAVDRAGHQYGAQSDEYRDAARRIDAQLSEALADLDLERDAIIIVADHGHTSRGGHGGNETEVMDVPLIMAGAGVRPGAMVAHAQLIDVAPTIAALLGVPAPGHGLGHTLTEALDIDPAAAASIASSDAVRVTRNAEYIDAAATRAAAEVDSNRVRRLSLVVAAIGLALVVLVLGTRMGAFHIDWRVLVIALPAFPFAFYALLDMAGQHFSLSALPDEGAGARRVFQFGAAAVAVHVVASWLSLRGRVVLRDRLAAANAIAICGMLVAGIPAALAWAFFGAGPFVTLPPPQFLFLIPAMYIAVACYALAAATSLGLELIVFFARAVDPRLPLRRAEARVELEKLRLKGQIRVAPDHDDG